MTNNEPFKWDSVLGPVSKGLQAASGLLGMLSSFSTAKAYKETAGQYKLMAQQSLEEGFQTGIDIQHAGAEQLGEMTVAYGKSGTLLEGSPLLALADEARTIELNIARVIEQGRIRQQGFLHQARMAERAAKGEMWGGVARLATAAIGMI